MALMHRKHAVPFLFRRFQYQLHPAAHSTVRVTHLNVECLSLPINTHCARSCERWQTPSASGWRGLRLSGPPQPTSGRRSSSSSSKARLAPQPRLQTAPCTVPRPQGAQPMQLRPSQPVTQQLRYLQWCVSALADCQCGFYRKSHKRRLYPPQRSTPCKHDCLATIALQGS